MKCKDEEEIFLNYVDFTCYVCLSILYPVLVYFVQIEQTNYKQLQSISNLILTGLIFTLTFFYDFYLRFQGRNKKDSKISSLLGTGRFVFGGLSFYLLGLLILSISDFAYVSNVKPTFYLIPLSSCLPIIISYYGFKILKKNEKTNYSSVAHGSRPKRRNPSTKGKRNLSNKVKPSSNKKTSSANKNSIGNIKI